jgi:hypothetical protein
MINFFEEVTKNITYKKIEKTIYFLVNILKYMKLLRSFYSINLLNVYKY